MNNHNSIVLPVLTDTRKCKRKKLKFPHDRFCVVPDYLYSHLLYFKKCIVHVNSVIYCSVALPDMINSKHGFFV